MCSRELPTPDWLSGPPPLLPIDLPCFHPQKNIYASDFYQKHLMTAVSCLKWNPTTKSVPPIILNRMIGPELSAHGTGLVNSSLLLALFAWLAQFNCFNFPLGNLKKSNISGLNSRLTQKLKCCGQKAVALCESHFFGWNSTSVWNLFVWVWGWFEETKC